MAFKTTHGKYLLASADFDERPYQSSKLGDFEKFWLFPYGNGNFAIESIHYGFLSTRGAGKK